ncbi:LLM class flavin-dependent oxidoreductase [Mucilaginibacter terrae]|uniref:Luciferase family oxidoreductase group 1 n=1 Tax=Mucilaginibacter terrae TaxID=1955052 RepID=A0ABU3GPA4_9SPHI|nr:LLM class flavin-dependent oxidoreductase [Mucilaginibacter terrae]MDT3401351.1 luciferase family oxidoreductase group 1 [Mucilaginibacter terrae]
MNIKYSVLDLATVIQGDQPADTFKKSLDLARHVEHLGYERFWLAEHHNMPNVASSATAVLIGHIAGGTRILRVGSGGVMLPNHAPLIVAEQFGTLESLYPGRIDLGLGRAPGTDQLTAFAIRGENFRVEQDFPGDIRRLQQFFSSENSTSKVRAIPGEGLDIPLWILGSSPESAFVAAELGLPYAFASHFAPAHFMSAIALYREHFKPSGRLKEPYVLACVNVIAAASDQEADRLFTSLQQFFLGIVSDKRKPLQPPVDSMDGLWKYHERVATERMLAYSFVGSPEKLRSELSAFLQQSQVNEVMATSHVFDHQARLDSYRIFAETVKSLNLHSL